MEIGVECQSVRYVDYHGSVYYRRQLSEFHIHTEHKSVPASG